MRKGLPDESPDKDPGSAGTWSRKAENSASPRADRVHDLPASVQRGKRPTNPSRRTPNSAPSAPSPITTIFGANRLNILRITVSGGSVKGFIAEEENIRGFQIIQVVVIIQAAESMHIGWRTHFPASLAACSNGLAKLILQITAHVRLSERFLLRCLKRKSSRPEYLSDRYGFAACPEGHK